MSSSVSAGVAVGVPSIMVVKRSFFFSWSAMTFSSMVFAATMR